MGLRQKSFGYRGSKAPSFASGALSRFLRRNIRLPPRDPKIQDCVFAVFRTALGLRCRVGVKVLGKSWLAEMDLTISTVYFNSEYIGAATQSVATSQFSGSLEHVVVDNASAVQGHLSDAIQRVPTLRVIRSQTNAGFAGANNRALEIAAGKYFLLMNPDVVLERNTLQVLFDFMELQPDVVAVSCQIVDSEGQVLASRRRFPTPWTMISRIVPFFPFRKKILSEYEMTDVDTGTTHEADWLSGGFLFCRTEPLRLVGGLDERYFLYFEDVDLCRSLRKHGKLLYLPLAKCKHLTKHASRKSPKLFRLHVTSSLKYFLKWGV